MWTVYIYIAVTLAALAMSLYAAYSDWRRYTIPNFISLIVIALYPVAVLTAPGEIDWLFSLLTAAIVFAVGFTLFAVGFLGGGDVKIFTALSLWSGPALILPFLVAVVLAGGILVFVVIAREAIKQAPEKGGFFRGARSAVKSKTPVPYGVAIAFGSLFIFFSYLNAASILG